MVRRRCPSSTGRRGRDKGPGRTSASDDDELVLLEEGCLYVCKDRQARSLFAFGERRRRRAASRCVHGREGRRGKAPGVGQGEIRGREEPVSLMVAHLPAGEPGRRRRERPQTLVDAIIELMGGELGLDEDWKDARDGLPRAREFAQRGDGGARAHGPRARPSGQLALAFGRPDPAVRAVMDQQGASKSARSQGGRPTVRRGK